jgi:FAD/FMN-containing dehydrogenase
MAEWSNWSGSLTFEPARIYHLKTEDEIVNLVRRCRAENRTIRVAGSGHSSSALVQTDDTIISLKYFKGITSIDRDAMTATLKTGMTVEETNKALEREGYALFNTGDVDVQYLAGAISTGTHGTGRRLQNLSAMLVGVRLVTANGEIVEYHCKHHPEMIKAFRVSLGALGIITEITVKILPLFRLKRREVFASMGDCFRYFDQLAEENRNVDFYWYPRRDEVKIRILNEPDKGSMKLPFPHVVHRHEKDVVGEVLPRERDLRFDETEFAFDAETAWECFRLVRKRIKEKHRRTVAWRTLFRTIARDDAFLSPHFGRDSVTISLHHNAGLPYKDYFNDIEAIFKDFDGRPHWGKKHNLKGKSLKRLYPDWDRFHQIRNQMDPEEVFLNEYLRKLFNDHEE